MRDADHGVSSEMMDMPYPRHTLEAVLEVTLEVILEHMCSG